MSQLNVNMRSAMPYTMLPNVFIDYYLSVPNPAFALVYITFYRHCAAGGENVSVEYVAERLNILESDVVNALRYWAKRGLIELAQDGESMDIDFLPLHPPDQAEEQAEGQGRFPSSAVTPPSVPASSIPASSIPASSIPIEARPNYTAQELEVYREANADLRNMFTIAAQVLGKLLSHNDMNVLFSLYDWLRFPVPLIEHLLTYCAENDHRNMRYIEKCALDWAENGVKTVEDALEYTGRYNGGYREILRAFGHTGRNPTASEVKYMQKWLVQYAMPLTVIAEACDKTIMQIGQPKFSYADKILTRWHEQGVTTVEEAAELEERFRTQEKTAAAKKKSAVKTAPKTNRFVNFKQREWDYDKIEQLERQFLINGAVDK